VQPRRDFVFNVEPPHVVDVFMQLHEPAVPNIARLVDILGVPMVFCSLLHSASASGN